MSEATTNRWNGLLDALLSADSTLSSAIAASNIVDEAVPGGAVTATDCADLVRMIRSIEIRGHPYRTHVIAILLWIASWVTIWRRSVAAGASRVSPLNVSSEIATENELAAACADFVDLVHDENPEMRSLTYLFIGTSAMPTTAAVTHLEEILGQEKHLVARACAVQALVKTILRLPNEDRSRVARRVMECIVTDTDLARVKDEQRSNIYAPSERRELCDLIPIGQGEGSGEPHYWPAEGI